MADPLPALPLDCGLPASIPVLHVRRPSTVVKSHLELHAFLLQWPMKPVVGRAPHPLLSSCACQCARLACSVKDCFEDPLCCCSGSFVATCLVQFSSSLQWLHKANSTSYATAVCLVRQLSRCSACFCSPLWVHEEAFDFLSQLLALQWLISSSLQWLQKANSSSDATAERRFRQFSRCSACFCSPLWVHEEVFDFLSQLLALLCMPLGRKARGQGQKWRSFGAAVRTWPILLAFKCIWWRRPGQGHGYIAALVVDFCVSVAEG